LLKKDTHEPTREGGGTKRSPGQSQSPYSSKRGPLLPVWEPPEENVWEAPISGLQYQLRGGGGGGGGGGALSHEPTKEHPNEDEYRVSTYSGWGGKTEEASDPSCIEGGIVSSKVWEGPRGTKVR